MFDEFKMTESLLGKKITSFSSATACQERFNIKGPLMAIQKAIIKIVVMN